MHGLACGRADVWAAIRKPMNSSESMLMLTLKLMMLSGT